MTAVGHYGRTATGIQTVPWEWSRTPPIATTGVPTISGSAAPGQTVTAVTGTYTPAGWTHLAWAWEQLDAGGVVFGTPGTGATFAIPAGSPTGTLRLTQQVVFGGRTHSASATLANITATALAPLFSNSPTITSAGTTVGSVLTATPATATGTPTPTVSGQWRRDGNNISGQTATTHTSSAAGAFTYRNTATNGVAPDATSAVSNGITIIIVGGSVFATVSTLSAAIAAARTAPGGSRIEVTPGVKAAEAVTNSTATPVKTSPVTIAAQNPNNPPIFQVNSNYNNILVLTNWNDIAFDGLQFNNPNTKDWRNGPGFTESISSGVPNPNIEGARWTPFGIRLVDCNDVKITNCIFRELNGAIDVTSGNAGASNYEISYNTVVDSRLDSFRFYQRCVNWDVHHNKITHEAIMAWQNDLNRHQDANQLALTGSRPLGCNGVRFYDNWTQSLQVGTNMHGYFLHNERVAENGLALATYGHRNISVKRCMVTGANAYGIGWSGVDGGVCEQNIIRWSPGQQAFATANSNPGNHTPCYYLNTPRNNNITFNNCVGVAYPGTSTLSDGPGSQTGGSWTNMVASNTAVPTGWATTDVALGRYGAYGDSAAD